VVQVVELAVAGREVLRALAHEAHIRVRAPTGGAVDELCEEGAQDAKP
jgi:hypothetical protein